MAQSAASAVSILNSKPLPPRHLNSSILSSKPLPPRHLNSSRPEHKHKHKLQQGIGCIKTQSLISSQCSSRNSSISPRDREKDRDRNSGPVSIIARSTSSSRMSPMISVTPKPGAGVSSSQVSPKPLFRSSSTKKKPTQFVGPMIPWVKRNCGPPKHSNGWGWLGEGTEQVVYLNVSISKF